MSRSPLGPSPSPGPRLCAAIVDRLTFAGQIIETETVSYRLAHAADNSTTPPKAETAPAH